ncbi:hypothetical protein BH10CYA1_BH10CYA1_25460 [soil metagenome]
MIVDICKKLLVISIVVVTIWGVIKYFNKQNWTSLNGKVVETNVCQFTSRGRGGTGTTFRVKVKYIYVLNHLSYIKEELIGSHFRDQDAAASLQKQYWKGQHLRVLYNPEDPNQSSLNRTWF